MIHDAVGGTADDLVIFCGSGATAAVSKLIGILELRIPAGLDERYDLCARIPESERPVVFVGPYEHHSNELPWRESIADVVVIAEDPDGHIDVADLERQLIRFASRALRIGSFSAASNVTGILTDTDAVSRLLHAHGALSFWDYAAAGPYVPIRVAPSAPGAGDHKDAVFLSPHKFPGGPQTPGVLVVRRGTGPQRRARPCPAAARWRSSTRPATATSTTRWRARRAVPRPSSSRSGPAWCSASSRPSART